MNYSIKKNKSYELALTVDFDKADLEYYLNEARKYLANDLKLDGFRKGKVPLDIAKEKLDKNRVLETAFNLAFRKSFGEVLSKEKLEVIETGNFQVKKNSPQKLVYSVILTVFPEFEIKNYKNIKVDKKEISVSQIEVDEVAESIRKSRAANSRHPELNDDFAKSLGRFKDVQELKDSIEKGLKQEKEIKESQRIQAAILDKIAESARIEIPLILIDRQLDQMMLDLDADLHRQGMELGPYLAKIKKTREALRDEWKPKAETLAKKALILKEIAKKEKIEVGPEEVNGKVDQFLGSFMTPDEAQKNIDLPKLSDQIRQILLNQKVLAFLEKQAEYVSD